MPRRLLGPDPRQERATQQRLTSRIANAQAGAIQRAVRRAMKNAADAFEAEGESSVVSAINDQRADVERTIQGMYESAWSTIGGRVLRAAKSLHGREWVTKQNPDDEHAEALRQFIAAHAAHRVSLIQTTTEQQVKSIIQRAVREGVGTDEIAKRIRNNASQMGRVRSQIIARTEVHMAGQAGQDEAARAGGVAEQKEWFASLDDRTRDDKFSHVDADGEVTSTDGVFTNTGEDMRYPGDPRGSSGNTVMCFTPDTRVRGRFEAGTRVLYDGDVLRVKTRAGRRLTVTPNHPLMTDHGLTPADRLGEGDYLVTDGLKVEHALRVADHDRQHGPAPISEVFRALSNLGASCSVGVRRVDFHGDGVFGQGDIDVVEVDGHLVYGMETAFSQTLDDLGFVHADPVGRVNVTGRHPTLGIERARLSSARIMRRLGVRLALLGRHAFHASVHRLASVARLNAAVAQPVVDGAAIDIEPAGQGQDRLSLSDMPVDEIISIERVPYRGHVYDLQEASGLMVAEGIVTSNCRCGQGYIVD